VFDHVEARRFAEQPAREYPAVLRGTAFADIDLNEGAGFLRQFPRRGAFARGQANDHRAERAALAGLEADVLTDIIALVEQAQHCDAFFHRGGAVIIDRCGLPSLGGGGGHRLGDRNLDGLGR
jgi:hypothetical protein